LTVHHEHVWARDEFAGLASSCGWKIRVFGSTSVAGGGADGWVCECLILER
jgi:hypothetical protein